MESLGNIIKKRRLEKKLTLEDINKSTQIGIELLKNIEKDNLENLNIGSTYLRLILKKLCKFLDIDSEKILSLANLQKEEEFKPALKYEEGESNRKKFMLSKYFFSSIGLILLIIVLSLLVFKFYSSGLLENPFERLMHLNSKTKEISEKEISKKEKSDDAKPSKEKKINEENKKDIKAEKKEKIDKTIEETEYICVIDTVDYIDKHLFKEKKHNPLNYKETKLEYIKKDEIQKN